MPFDLNTIDSQCFTGTAFTLFNEKENKELNIYNILIELSKFYLKSSSKAREAAAIFLSYFFSRPDI